LREAEEAYHATVAQAAVTFEEDGVEAKTQGQK
jgi:hypothetical protein